MNPIECAPRPRRLAAGREFGEITAGNGHLCARNSSGEVYGWGAGAADQPGRGPEPVRRVSAGAGRGFLALASRGVQSCAIVEAGMVYCWGQERAALAGEPAPRDGLRRIQARARRR